MLVKSIEYKILSGGRPRRKKKMLSKIIHIIIVSAST